MIEGYIIVHRSKCQDCHGSGMIVHPLWAKYFAENPEPLTTEAMDVWWEVNGYGPEDHRDSAGPNHSQSGAAAQIFQQSRRRWGDEWMSIGQAEAGGAIQICRSPFHGNDNAQTPYNAPILGDRSFCGLKTRNKEQLEMSADYCAREHLATSDNDVRRTRPPLVLRRLVSNLLRKEQL